jgi:hypothetical protein
MKKTRAVLYDGDSLIQEISDVVQQKIEAGLKLFSSASAKKNQATPRYLTRHEAVDYLRVSYSSLHRYVRLGYIHPVKVGGKTLFEAGDLEKMIIHLNY